MKTGEKNQVEKLIKQHFDCLTLSRLETVNHTQTLVYIATEQSNVLFELVFQRETDQNMIE